MKRRLLDAIEEADIHVVFDLLERGIDVNYELWNDDIYITPLMEASIDPDIFIVSALLNKGADINFYNDNGTALHFAVINDTHTDILKLLLLEGANPFIRDDDDETPYDIAIRNNFIEHAELLKDRMIHIIQNKYRRNRRIKTLKKNKKSLALMRSMDSREGPMASVRYDPSLLENISRFL